MARQQEDITVNGSPDPARVLLIRAGRGNSGGTTALNATIELAHMEGRAPIILDAARNPSLSALYPATAFRPASHSVTDTKEAISSKVLDGMMETGQSGVIDLGGGQDDTLASFTLDLDLVEFGQVAGIRPVFMVSFGPNMDDFEHVLEIKRRGLFDNAGVLLVQSEGILRRDQEPGKAFAAIRARPEFVDWVMDGARPLYLPTLPCMEQARKTNAPLREAADIKTPAGKSLGFTKAYQVNKWLTDWKRSFVDNDCSDWRV